MSDGLRGVRAGRRIEVRGSAHGVGFRPWTVRLAQELSLAGRVWSGVAGVTIEAFGAPDALDRLVERLDREPPPGARIERVWWREIPDEALAEFVIVHPQDDEAGGWVPRPVRVPQRFVEPVLAVGGDRDNACAIGIEDEVWLGPHVGDVATEAGWDALGMAIERLTKVLGVKPQVIAHDLHPGYHSTRWAEDHPGVVKVGVQHHHAHVAGALAARGHTRGIGVAYDGSGYGADGSGWGGELLAVEGARFERLATWRAIALPGGDLAIREPWRIAVAWLLDAFEGRLPPLPWELPPAAIRAVRQQVELGVQTASAHGIGRRFDAIGALALGRPRATFEGQLAIAWEGALEGAHGEAYPYEIHWDRSPWEVDDRAMLRAVVADLAARAPIATISARFHATVAAATVDLVARAREREALPVVLSGGCFANARLVSAILERIPDVELPRDVPPGNGGLALGQAVVANAGAVHR